MQSLKLQTIPMMTWFFPTGSKAAGWSPFWINEKGGAYRLKVECARGCMLKAAPKGFCMA